MDWMDGWILATFETHDGKTPWVAGFFELEGLARVLARASTIIVAGELLPAELVGGPRLWVM
jgi:hypothetical protein